MHVPEEAASRPCCVGQSAQATNVVKSTAKSTMAKLRAPLAVGLPKPPQIFAKARELVFVCQSMMIPFTCRMRTVHVLLVFGMKPINIYRPVLRMAVGCGRWEVVLKHKHKGRNETSSITPRVNVGVLQHSLLSILGPRLLL